MSNHNPPRRRTRSPRSGGDDRPYYGRSPSDRLDDNFLQSEDMLEGERDYEIVFAARERNRRMREEEEG